MKHTTVMKWGQDGPERHKRNARYLFDLLIGVNPYTIQQVEFDDPALFVEKGTGRKLEVYVYTVSVGTDIQNYMFIDHGHHDRLNDKFTMVAMNSFTERQAEVKPYAQFFIKVPKLDVITAALNGCFKPFLEAYNEIQRKPHIAQMKEARTELIRLANAYDIEAEIEGDTSKTIEVEFEHNDFRLWLDIALNFHTDNQDRPLGFSVSFEYLTYFQDDEISLLLDFFDMEQISSFYQSRINELQSNG